jgi:hypothetical protein
MARQLFLGQAHEVVDSDLQFGMLVSSGTRCARRTTYIGFIAPFQAACVAVGARGGTFPEDLDFRTQLLVVCEQCHTPLPDVALYSLIMRSPPPGRAVMTAGLGLPKVDACPRCDEPACFLLYDPEGFAKSRVREIAQYLVYADLARAKQFFDLIRTRLDQARETEFSFHGVVEMRTDTRSKDALFPHYVVIHFKGVTSPAKLFDTFFEDLDITGGALNFNDHDIRTSVEDITETNKGTHLHDSIVF